MPRNSGQKDLAIRITPGDLISRGACGEVWRLIRDLQAKGLRTVDGNVIDRKDSAYPRGDSALAAMNIEFYLADVFWYETNVAIRAMQFAERSVGIKRGMQDNPIFQSVRNELNKAILIWNGNPERMTLLAFQKKMKSEIAATALSTKARKYANAIFASLQAVLSKEFVDSMSKIYPEEKLHVGIIQRGVIRASIEAARDGGLSYLEKGRILQIDSIYTLQDIARQDASAGEIDINALANAKAINGANAITSTNASMENMLYHIALWMRKTPDDQTKTVFYNILMGYTAEESIAELKDKRKFRRVIRQGAAK